MSHRHYSAVLAIAVTLITATQARAQGSLAPTPSVGRMCTGMRYRVDFSVVPEPHLLAYPVIDDVIKGSAADSAGIQPGDTLIAANGKDFMREMAAGLRVAPGSMITVQIRRAGITKDFSIRTGVWKATAVRPETPDGRLCARVED